jgi:hypothetical protein
MLHVISAAIRVGDLIISRPKPTRHHSILYNAARAFGMPETLWEQGFLLSDGCFANRTAARKVAEAAGQLIERAQNKKQLFSEDVW